MNGISFLLAFLASIVFSWNAPVQVESQPTELIVELRANQYAGFRQVLVSAGVVFHLRRIHPASDFYRLDVSGRSDTKAWLDRLRQEGKLANWQYDRPVIPRNTPNDPLFTDQWDMERIGMPEAWNRSTGGVTAMGDTIVVAILDTGFESDHEDLSGNVWINHGEIPGDGIDNDLNGYTDDYRGLNIQTGDDQHEVDIHGTAVAGIIGGKGDNNKGISGINWNVKMLLISGIGKESDIIEGYEYARALRNTYRSTGGASGAYVVVTSLSAGIDNALPADHPLWCEQYDLMGQSGIISVCATTNGNSDVDMFGDMPTTCPSPYMLTVTNTGMDDKKLLFAGYGVINVDLGAPGTPTLTTAIGDGYQDFEGTSAAAPHVSGAIALLYAVACTNVLSLAISDPPAMVEQMSALIQDNVDPVAGMETQTASGGRLNVAAAVAALDALCGTTGGDLEVLSITPNPVIDATTVSYHIPEPGSYEISVVDMAGRLLMRDKPGNPSPGIQSYTLLVKDLVPGVYQFIVRQGNEISTASFLVQ